MIQPKEIIRCNRKTLTLTIDSSGGLVVKAPLGLPEYEIYKFIQEKEEWIMSKIKKANSLSQINSNLMNYDEFLLFGVNYPVVRDSFAKSANFSRNQCVVPKGLDHKQTLHKVILTYKRLANKWLKERTLEIASAINTRFDEFKISDTKGRWGCCTSNCCINLNWRVVCLKPALIDYVIVHELCHLREMNHSPKFWTEVGKILPDFKKRRKLVKEMSFLFQIYKD